MCANDLLTNALKSKQKNHRILFFGRGATNPPRRLQLDLPSLFSDIGVFKVTTCFVQYLVHCLIVVAGVVVEQNQTLYIALASDARGLQPGTVAPTLLGKIFVGRVLRIVNQHISILRELSQGLVELIMSVLKIAGMGNHGVFRFDSVSGSALGVIQGK